MMIITTEHNLILLENMPGSSNCVYLEVGGMYVPCFYIPVGMAAAQVQ